jgi:phosphohistidine phosphatase
MKHLFLVRHAKSSWDDPALADFDRPLNTRGERAAPIMGKRLRERGIHPDWMISSPAVRALSTCRLLAEKLGFAETKIKTDRTLYHASEDQLLHVVKNIPDLPDTEEVAFLFGHNPGLTEFANRLLGEQIENIPTCGVVEAQLKIARWQDAYWGCGRLVDFDFPKKRKH